MKYFLLCFFILFFVNVKAEMPTEAIPSSSNEMLQSIFTKLQLKYPNLDISRLSNVVDWTVSCNSERAACNSSYIVTLRVINNSSENNRDISAILRFNSVLDSNGYNLGLSRNIYSNDIVFLHEKNGKRTLFFGAESELLNEPCYAPTYTFGVQNVSCLDRWEKNIFTKIINQKLTAEANMLIKRINNTMTQKDLVDNSIAIASAIISVSNVNGAKKIVEGVIQSENLIMGYAMDNTSTNGSAAIKFTNDLIVSYISALQAGSSPKDAIDLAVDQIGKIAEISNNIVHAFILGSLTEKLNGVRIARLYLNEYYQYAGDNGWVAFNNGQYRSASLWDTIDAVAIKNGYENTLFDTEYNIDDIKEVIEDYKYIIVRELALRCMKIKGSCKS